MKRYHVGYRYVLWAYVILFIGWWVSVVAHANPIPPAQVMIEITTQSRCSDKVIADGAVRRGARKCAHDSC